MEAIIMTGGKGTRMQPFTNVLPKGLLPIGERPILEIIVCQLKEHGFDKITMACGYLAKMIQLYFGTGEDWGVSIDYYVEDTALGTAGPLSFIKRPDKPFLVINCDVLTNLCFSDFYQFHLAKKSLITIASQERKTPIHLGVIETKGEQVIRIVEKPVQKSTVSMGIYIMDPKIVEYVPSCRFDVPDLVQKLLNDNKKITHYKNDAYWFDIGSIADYERANKSYPDMIQDGDIK